MSLQRVVVTGIGVVSPIGLGKEAFWESIVEGRSGVGLITRFDNDDIPVRIAAEVKDFKPEDYLDRKEAKRMDRFSQYGLAAAQMAWQDARLDEKTIPGERIGVFVGSGVGGMETLEQQMATFLDRGFRRVSPFFVPMMIVNMAAGLISMAFGAKGPSSSTVTACATGAHSIGDALRAIQHGEADAILAGGTEASITPLSTAGFASARALSTNNDNPAGASRPFDSKRDGFVMGEGAGIVVLETLESALKRGVPIYAEVLGYGRTSDAYHMTHPAPEGEGAARCMTLAMNDGGVSPQMIDYINAHGTSTPLNDKYETMAIKGVFGQHAYKLAVSSTKSMTGHLLGAAGAVEFITTTLALQNGILPPTINYEFPDPDCDLDYVPNKARYQSIKYALTNSFGFGGQNATLLLSKYEDN